MRLAIFISAVFIGLSSSDITGTNPASGTSLCVNGNRVNVRRTPCGSVIGNSNSGACYKYKGQKQTCRLSGTTYEFFSVQYGTGGWIAGSFLNNVPSSHQSPQSSTPSGCPRIISRAEWGARAPKSVTNIRHPVSRIFVHHSAGNSCYNQADCSATVRSIQKYHMDTKGWSDIGYNFLIGEDGNIYEGKGWDKVGAHATNFNGVAIGTCFMGTFTTKNPKAAALTALQQLISCGISKGKLSSSYSLHGHRDAGCTSCPGDTLYATIRTWPRYAGVLPGKVKC